MPPIWSKQPLKALYTIFIVGISPVYFPLLALYYLPKRLRPHPGWSLHTAMGNALYRLMFSYMAKVRMGPMYALESNAPKDRFVLVPCAPDTMYTGVLAHTTIKPVPFGAIWFPYAPTPEDIKTKKIVLHLPGGAYVIASPPSSTGQFPSSVYAEKADALTLYAQYRVADTPATRFPAALQDAVTFYAYLLRLGVPAEHIIVSGDSAGGNLVLALLRYIDEYAKTGGADLPNPRGAIVWSPWVNVTPAAVAAYKRSAKNSTDLVPWQILAWGLEAYPPPAAEASKAVDPYISPMQHPFATRTPLVVQAGSAEVFCEDACAFARKMAGVEGNRVKYWETPHAPHDLALCGKLLGMVTEAKDVVDVANAFFEDAAYASSDSQSRASL